MVIFLDGSKAVNMKPYDWGDQDPSFFQQMRQFWARDEKLCLFAAFDVL